MSDEAIAAAFHGDPYLTECVASDGGCDYAMVERRESASQSTNSQPTEALTEQPTEQQTSKQTEEPTEIPTERWFCVYCQEFIEDNARACLTSCCKAPVHTQCHAANERNTSSTHLCIVNCAASRPLPLELSPAVKDIIDCLNKTKRKAAMVDEAEQQERAQGHVQQQQNEYSLEMVLEQSRREANDAGAGAAAVQQIDQDEQSGAVEEQAIGGEQPSESAPSGQAEEENNGAEQQ